MPEKTTRPMHTMLTAAVPTGRQPTRLASRLERIGM
jgi:hypothetical protein